MLMRPYSSATEMDVRISLAGTGDLPDAAAWVALAQGAGEANPFFEHWYLSAALDHLREDRPVWIAQGWQDGALVGLMPLAIQNNYGRVPARFVGNWTHYQCFMGTPLVRAGMEEPWAKALLGALDRADWAPGFLSLSGLERDGATHQGLCAAAAQLDRPCPIVHHKSRALLHSELEGEAYLETHIRAKKRKEWRRLGYRISELGTLVSTTLADESDLSDWCDVFLSLEAAGWKGERGAAFANAAATRGFFHRMMAGAWATGRLEFLRLDLNGEAIAMLINFRTPPASWSYKIAYDERLSRFSPGVMIEIENLMRVLADPDIDWMDSCAVEDHPMINSLWAERRQIVQVSVPLSGLKRRATYALCRAAEEASARVRAWRIPAGDLE